MWNVAYKALKDFSKYVSSIGGAFILTVVIPTVVQIYLKRKVDLEFIFGYASILLIFLGVVYIYFLFKRLMLKISKNNIHILPTRSDKFPRDKIFLKIRNDNDEDFINVNAELVKIFVGETGEISLSINSDQKCFSRGLKEKNNVITGNNHTEIEIAENVNGKLDLLLDDEASYDILSNMEEYKKQEVFRLIIKISGKLLNGDLIGFSQFYEAKFRHFINEAVLEIIGNDQPKFISQIMWLNLEKELNPIKT